jgi:hypothetical protein
MMKIIILLSTYILLAGCAAPQTNTCLIKATEDYDSVPTDYCGQCYQHTDSFHILGDECLVDSENGVSLEYCSNCIDIVEDKSRQEWIDNFDKANNVCKQLYGGIAYADRVYCKIGDISYYLQCLIGNSTEPRILDSNFSVTNISPCESGDVYLDYTLPEGEDFIFEQLAKK